MARVTRRFATTGMHCPSCSMLIRMDLSDLPGVSSATADHRSSMTEVVYDDEVIGSAEIIAAITRAGYGAELVED
ncbi:MAG: copper chaperone [Actinobacteria bacterium]|nr:copper chaperone [Actinomycetota bacterium]